MGLTLLGRGAANRTVIIRMLRGIGDNLYGVPYNERIPSKTTIATGLQGIPPKWTYEIFMHYLHKPIPENWSKCRGVITLQFKKHQPRYHLEVNLHCICTTAKKWYVKRIEKHRIPRVTFPAGTRWRLRESLHVYDQGWHKI